MASTPDNRSPNDSPPYPYPRAYLSGTPTPLPDTPLIIIFLVLFTTALALDIVAHYFDHVNARRHHPPSGLLNTTITADTTTHPICDDTQPIPHDPKPTHLLPSLRTTFLLSRLAALATRLAWTYHQHHHHHPASSTNSPINLEIASTTLTFAVPIFLLIANALAARRFVRDYAPFGRHPAVTLVARGVVFCAVVALVMGVSGHVDAYFSGTEEGLREVRVLGLVAGCIRVGVAVVPVLGVMGVLLMLGGYGRFMVAGGREMGRGWNERRLWARGGLVVLVGILLTLEEGFRTGVAFEGRRLGSEAWFLSKACFYCFGFLVEVLVVYAWLGARLDSRFRVRPREKERDGLDGERKRVDWWERLRDRINTEAECFGCSGQR